MSMLGKMSVGVRAIVSGPTIRISRASTTNVYGRLSAMRTIHMAYPIILAWRHTLVATCCHMNQFGDEYDAAWHGRRHTRNLAEKALRGVRRGVRLLRRRLLV